MAAAASSSDLETLTLPAEELAFLCQFDFVRLTVADLNGIGRCKVVPRRHAEESAQRGIDLFAGVLVLGLSPENALIDELERVRYDNATARPMPGTLRPLPWATDGKFKVGEVLCETFWLPPFRDGGHQTACPRYVARQQLKRLKGLGYSLYSSFEAEFVACHKAGLKPVFEGNDIFSTVELSPFENYLYEMDAHLVTTGVDVGTLQTEFSEGQFEFALKPCHGVEAADRMFRLKHGVKEMSLQRDYTATFMTMTNEHVGNGLHFNHSLWTEDCEANCFHDPTDPDGLSGSARGWIAGLCAHAPALTALCSPTVNCYRRLHAPWTPGCADWGVGDRCAAFRFKNISPHETYIENRIGGGAANPYLVLAATVAAGMAGITQGLTCPPQRGGGEEVTRLPCSLVEALEALEKDEVLVEALGEEFVRWFVQMKRDTEVKVLKEGSLEDERKLYHKLL